MFWNCSAFPCAIAALPTTQVFVIWLTGIAGLSPQTLLAGICVCRRECFIARFRLVESEINFSASLPLNFPFCSFLLWLHPLRVAPEAFQVVTKADRKSTR